MIRVKKILQRKKIINILNKYNKLNNDAIKKINKIIR
jgi:hypothetical protein